MSISLGDIHLRTLDYANDDEMVKYLRLFWDIPLEHNEYFTRRTDAFVREWMKTARETENETNTYCGIALHSSDIVGVHIARRFEEYEQTGVHIAGLWVHPSYRHLGIARELKLSGERWARSVGAQFMNTNVQTENDRMISINERAGYSLFRLNFRKRL